MPTRAPAEGSVRGGGAEASGLDLGGGISPSASAADGSATPQELYLDVTINGEATGLIARFVSRHGRLSASGRDLRDLGILTDRLGLTAQPDVSLDTIIGLRYTFDAARQSVSLQVPDALRQPNTLNARGISAPPTATSQRGLVVNYDIYSEATPRWRTSMFDEFRYFAPSGVFSLTGILDINGGQTRFTRYDTSWTRSKQDSLSTLLMGDTLSSSLGWSRSVRMGGIQWRRNFALRPDLVTYPIPSLRGTTAVPSSVDLYINDIRQFSSQVPTGPFVLNQVPGITGAGVATVVTRDALGRSVTTSVPLYVDTRLLATGLTSYSVEAGFLRRNYGLSSFDYDTRPVISETTAYGYTSEITLNSHAEVSTGQGVVGAGGLVRLGQAGVLNGALAFSAGRYAGQQVDLGYQLIRPNFSINADTIRTLANYGDIAAREGDVVPTAQDRATVSFPFLKRQSLALSYIGLRQRTGPRSRIGSLSYVVNIGTIGSVNLSLFKDFGDQPTNGFFVSVNVGLGSSRGGGTGTSVNTTMGRQNGANSYNVSASRPSDYAGGFGWAVQHGRAGTLGYDQGQVSYIGNPGEVTAVAQSFQGQVNTSLDLQGAVVFMDGAALMSRRIDDAFALVSTDGVKDIPVLHQNRVIGNTNSRGLLLIPDLNAYQHNQVSIDAMKLPADARVASTALDLVPESRTGVLGRFGIGHYDAASITLVDENRLPIAPGLRVINEDNGKETIVGYDGQTFVDDLRPTNRLRITDGQRSCEVRFDYQRATNGGLQAIGPLVCGGGVGKTPRAGLPTGAQAEKQDDSPAVRTMTPRSEIPLSVRGALR
ncbi:fimbria/pilus outer membrane usher protein [Robbsia andropogonis]|uniref:fimbria/pilus outer membrane usher protein n=1 Tax=Robbsia andropogonis TaxID=28092 RepID=UPI0016430A84|nr:fimbria/pilus outer membrane usher protein [Robbsia andropogonis]MCP1120131.1 fimbria/pilus outer membrane usher protein [Robbsia andropogonis]MCP1130037.1 fimbria/pilus outer membrane usher protein [Robbsia andropogonis]